RLILGLVRSFPPCAGLRLAQEPARCHAECGAREGRAVRLRTTAFGGRLKLVESLEVVKRGWGLGVHAPNMEIGVAITSESKASVDFAEFFEAEYATLARAVF